MSRAFVKDDAPDSPVMVPPRAPLPQGVPNYVTPRGLALLRDELAALEAERSRLNATAAGDERTRSLALNAGQVAQLSARMASAQVVDPATQPPDEVRFGATVTLSARTAPHTRRFTIVGVDEADPLAGSVAFTSPIARAVMGRRVGETALLRTARGEEPLEVVAVSYGVD